MTLFYLKKNFCDGWDNMLWLVFANLMIIILIAATYFGASGILEITQLPSKVIMIISLAILAIGVFCITTVMFSINEACARIADYKSVTIKELFLKLKDVWKISLLFTLLLAGLAIVAIIGLPFYLKMNNFFGLFLAALLFWAVIITLIALQWFLPLYSRMHGGFKKTFKKCFIMFLDNGGFTFFLFIYNTVMFAMSLLLAFLVPGFSGIILAQNNALKLRLYKYDWIEQHPELTPKEARKQVPWEELIAEDRDIIGPRTLKSFIFPWK